MATTEIVWFRRDLRVHDHSALIAAARAADRVVPVFVLDDGLLGGRFASDVSPLAMARDRRWRRRCATRASSRSAIRGTSSPTSAPRGRTPCSRSSTAPG